MRDIEFRVWDNTEDKYIKRQNYCLDLLHNSIGWWDDLGGWVIDEETNNSLEIEQYTGLKDKNETKIFEGDIVRTFPRVFSDDDGDTVHRLPVVFSDKYASFILKGAQSLYWYIENFYGLEVIGNIHETPELL